MTINKYTYNWFTLAITVLGIGGGLAFVLGMSRAPQMSAYFPANFFSYALAGHVINAIIFWFMSFIIVIWSRSFNTKVPGTVIIAAIIGAVLVLASVFRASGNMVKNNYVPTIDDPVFFTGLALFFIAFTINVFFYIKESFKLFGSQDIEEDTIAVSVIIALIIFISFVYSLIFTRYGAGTDTFYERLYWIPGHIQQLLNGIILAFIWHKLTGNKNSYSPIETILLRASNRVILASSVLLLLTPLQFDPISGSAMKISSSVYAYGLGLPLFLHAIIVLKNNKFNLKSTAYSAVFLSIILYTIGAAIGYIGFGNDTRIPAHYHGTVGSITLAMMGYSFIFLKDYFSLEKLATIAKLQPFLYGLGMVSLVTGMFISGLHGAPRKVHGTAFTDDPVALFSLSLIGLGTVLAVSGGIIFVVYSLKVIIKGEKND